MKNYKALAAFLLLTATTVHAGVTVSLTAPATGGIYHENNNLTLSATASASGGYTMSKVEFFNGTTLIGSDTTSPYSFQWNNLQPGAYAITAVATAVKKSSPNQTATSAVANITVNARPIAKFTAPGGATIYQPPANVTLTATATDADGTVSKVEFFRGTFGGELLATISAPPYTFVWTGVPAGEYTIFVMATDNNGAQSNQNTGAEHRWVRVTSAVPQLHFIHVDHLNTPRLIENPSQQTVWAWDQLEPFGVNVPDENPSGLGAFQFPLRFPGQYHDKEWNLAYNYFRDYDPGIGRYIQSDPIGIRGGINSYTYASLNPLKRKDPRGLADEDFLGPGAGPLLPSEPFPSNPEQPYGDILGNSLSWEVNAAIEALRNELPGWACRAGCFGAAWGACMYGGVSQTTWTAAPWICRQAASYFCNQAVCKPVTCVPDITPPS